MKTLIIHIGAPKCGSSSIQDFFEIHKNPCFEKTKFIKLELAFASALNSNNHNNLISILESSFKECNYVILSHEVLFVLPNAIKNICKISSSLVDKINIIGFSRRTSDFIVSAYNQWGFRDKQTNEDIENILLENKLKPMYFFGAEKALILAILGGYNKQRRLSIIKWDISFNDISETVKDYNVEINAGLLPNKNSTKTLIESFCEKANLTLKEEYKKINFISNLKFNSYITEALNNTLIFGQNTLELHEDNEVLYKVSELFNKEAINTNLIPILKEFVDSYFLDSNTNFSKTYNLDETYFSSTNKLSKTEVLKIVFNEMNNRISNGVMLEKQKEINGILAQTLFNTYKNINVQPKNLVKDEVKQLSQKKVRGLKLLWHHTPEPIRKIGRKLLGI